LLKKWQDVVVFRLALFNCYRPAIL